MGHSTILPYRSALIPDELDGNTFALQKIGCVILAAGLGTRFGRQKVSAEIAPGVRFLDAVVRTARAAGIAQIVAVVPPGITVPDGIRTVINASGGGEQITSVRLGLAQLTNVSVSGALLWPVDHPRVATSSVVALLRVVQAGTSPIVVPAYEGRRGHPAYFARDTWRELVTVADGGARAVVRRYGAQVREVAVKDRGVIVDIDTQEDMVIDGADGLG